MFKECMHQLFWMGVITAPFVAMMQLPAPNWVKTDPHFPRGYVATERGTIVLRTELINAVIMMKDGKLTRVGTLLNRLNPVRFYQPASWEEEALWRQHFG